MNTSVGAIAGYCQPERPGSGGALDLQCPLHAVELALPAMAATGHTRSYRRREHLAGEELAELLDRPSEIALVAKGDAVGDVEAGLLAHVVHVMRELARK